jgi:hypothetical protein
MYRTRRAAARTASDLKGQAMGDFSVSDVDMQHEIGHGTLEQFWEALIAGEEKQAVQIYDEGAVLRSPQDGRKITGRTNIAARGLLEPGERLVKINSIVGYGRFWVCECEALQHEQLMLLVSIVEMDDGRIVRETRYRMPRHISSHAAAG